MKTVYMVDNSGSASCSIISRLGPEICVQINRILAKFCLLKVRGSGNYDTPCAWGLSVGHRVKVNDIRKRMRAY